MQTHPSVTDRKQHASKTELGRPAQPLLRCSNSLLTHDLADVVLQRSLVRSANVIVQRGLALPTVHLLRAQGFRRIGMAF